MFWLRACLPLSSTNRIGCDDTRADCTASKDNRARSASDMSAMSWPAASKASRSVDQGATGMPRSTALKYSVSCRVRSGRALVRAPACG